MHRSLWRYFDEQSIPVTATTIGTANATTATSAPHLTEATETYLSMKGAGRPKTFAAGVHRSLRYLVEIAGDKPIDAYVRTDANALRDHLRGRGLSSQTIKRNLSNLRATMNFVFKELGLEPSLAFSGVYLGEDVTTVKRKPMATKDIQTLQALCRRTDDEPRWIIALLSDTGLRLSEALGLTKEDVHLTATKPYIDIRPRPWRRLKTRSSKRQVPIVGQALWALQRACEAAQGPLIFPKYCTPTTCKGNSASAALNKWLSSKLQGADHIVLHSFRHSLRDRLRAVECPPDIIDDIGGWSKSGVGEGYGDGHKIEILHKWMLRIVA